MSNENVFQRSSGELYELIDGIEKGIDIINPTTRVRDFETIKASINFTAVNNQFVEGHNNVTLKMDANAEYSDQIITANGDGSKITIDGNGIQLRYKGQRDTSLIMHDEGRSIHWYLFSDGANKYWRAS